VRGNPLLPRGKERGGGANARRRVAGRLAQLAGRGIDNLRLAAQKGAVQPEHLVPGRLLFLYVHGVQQIFDAIRLLERVAVAVAFQEESAAGFFKPLQLAGVFRFAAARTNLADMCRAKAEGG
jgi:hypothetical protein